MQIKGAGSASLNLKLLKSSLVTSRHIVEATIGSISDLKCSLNAIKNSNSSVIIEAYRITYAISPNQIPRI